VKYENTVRIIPIRIYADVWLSSVSGSITREKNPMNARPKTFKNIPKKF
jgi:hypothetical protein